MRGLFSLQGIPVMLTIGKMLGMAAHGSNNPSVAAWYKRLLAEGTALIALAIVTGITAAALIVALFCGVFIYLRELGLEPLEAIGIVGAFALVATGGFLFYTVQRLKSFRSIPLRMENTDDMHSTSFSQLFGKAGEVADAFVDGLRSDKRPGNGAGPRGDRVH